MGDLNKTIITEFIITGFEKFHRFRIILFVFLLLLYLPICVGNISIVSLVPAVSHLHLPMYVFLSNLSLADVLITSDIVPNMLHILWTEKGNITMHVCILQFYIFGSLTATECLLLTVMSYDRYLAICNPLMYSSTMTLASCQNLIIFSWVVGFIPTLPVAISISRLKFCQGHAIEHFFCDLAPFLELACSDVSVVRFMAISFSFLVTFFPFVLIIISYSFIIHSILRIKSESGRQKAFSTCSSHLAVVSMYYGTLFVLYGVPSKKQSLIANKMLSLLYIFVTPLLNPVIYSLKNKEISRAATKIIYNLKKKISIT